MIRRLMCAVALAAAMTTGAIAGGHGGGDAPDRGPMSYLQHRLADMTGWDWLHPAVPVPTHGEHAAWEMVRADVLKVANSYRQDPAIELLAGDVAYFEAAFAADPTMEAQHRMDESTAALAQTLAWVARGDQPVERLLDNVEAVLEMNGSGELCGTEDILARERVAPDHGTADVTEEQHINPRWSLALLAGLLVFTLMRRRRWA